MTNHDFHQQQATELNRQNAIYFELLDDLADLQTLFLKNFKPLLQNGNQLQPTEIGHGETI